MAKVKITLGTSYVNCPSETFELECYDEKEFNSDKFSTEILNAILNGEGGHYFIEIEEPEEFDDECEDEWN